MAKKVIPTIEEKLENIEVEKAEIKPTKFKNIGNGIKIKLVNGKNFKWITVKKGEVVELQRAIALKNNLVEIE